MPRSPPPPLWARSPPCSWSSSSRSTWFRVSRRGPSRADGRVGDAQEADTDWKPSGTRPRQTTSRPRGDRRRHTHRRLDERPGDRPVAGTRSSTHGQAEEDRGRGPHALRRRFSAARRVARQREVSSPPRLGGTMRHFVSRVVGGLLTMALLIGLARPATAAPEGTLTWGVHITLASRWLDPAQTAGIITPFMVLYALHDALVKPMPAGQNTPSLAESWTSSKDGLTYEFVIRRGVKFHNGEPVTAADVKFSFARYKGAGAKLLKERVRAVPTVYPGRVRC